MPEPNNPQTEPKAGTFTLDGIASCTPGADDLGGVLDMGTSIGAYLTDKDLAGTEIVPQESFPDGSSSTTTATTYEAMDTTDTGTA